VHGAARLSWVGCAAAAPFALLWACSSASPVSGTSVSGTLGDAGFDVQSARATLSSVAVVPTGYAVVPDANAIIPPDATGTLATLTVTLTDNPSVTCAVAQAGLTSRYASTGALTLSLNAPGSVTPQAYSIGADAAPFASVTYASVTSTCDEGRGAIATAGSVLLTGVVDGGVTGTFNVTFGASDYVMQPALGTLTGSFATSLCPLVDAGIAELPEAGLACQP
jgi:hypothetical protein